MHATCTTIPCVYMAGFDSRFQQGDPMDGWCLPTVAYDQVAAECRQGVVEVARSDANSSMDRYRCGGWWVWVRDLGPSGCMMSDDGTYIGQGFGAAACSCSCWRASPCFLSCARQQRSFVFLRAARSPHHRLFIDTTVSSGILRSGRPYNALLLSPTQMLGRWIRSEQEISASFWVP